MTRRAITIASAIITIAMLVLAVMVGSSLPGDLQLPTHWNLSGEADGFSGKWQALLLPPGIAAISSCIFYSLPALEPRSRNLKRSQGLYFAGWAGLLLIAATIELVTVSAALGWEVAADRVIIGALGIMLALIGNQLGKSRRMYMVGIRTPWTLASEEVWIKTHRLGGKLMVLLGLLMVALSALSMSPDIRGLAIALSAGAAIIVPVVYSYLLWRREKVINARSQMVGAEDPGA
jgi:uncharacterized membrane protein